MSPGLFEFSSMTLSVSYASAVSLNRTSRSSCVCSTTCTRIFESSLKALACALNP